MRRFQAIRTAISIGGRRERFRVVHFSVQDSHIHPLVEADNKKSLGLGLRGLEIRIAHALNRELGRRGRVFEDRYHARPLKTPRETRNCLAYVLLNHRHHSQQRGNKLSNPTLDPCSSGRSFEGWREATNQPTPPHPPLVATAQTWLLRIGWKKHGLISLSEIPAH